MFLTSLTQTSKISTVAAVRSHTCSKVDTRGFHNIISVHGLALSDYESISNPRPHTTVDITLAKLCITNYSCLHRRVFNDRRQMEFLKGPVAARTLLGFLPLASLSAMGSKVFQRGVHVGHVPEIKELYKGNKAYIANVLETNPGLLQSLAVNGQKPPFMVVDCSDSRVDEQGIFSAKPGTMFTVSNIANQFDEDDLSSNAVLSYAVEFLKVKHVIVMGHYGCGGVGASMVPLPGLKPQFELPAVQNWILPIRQIYETSKRSEIVAHRTKHANTTASHDIPDLHDSAFRVLVEENVKANVNKIAKSAVMQKHYALVAKATTTPDDSEPITEVYIHGWVYDIENGQVSDLGVSVAPPGKAIPPTPFPITP